MAIIKFNNRKKSTTERSINQLRRALKYITDRNKTTPDMVGGYGVTEDNALARMTTVKEYYGKTDGREYMHFVVSPKGKCDVDLLYDLGNRVVKLFGEYQTLFAVHMNTANYHIHFIINSVSVTDGHKFSQSKKEMEVLKQNISSIMGGLGIEADWSQDDLYEYFNDDIQQEDFDKEECTNENLINPIIYDREVDGLIVPMIYIDEEDYYDYYEEDF